MKNYFLKFVFILLCVLGMNNISQANDVNRPFSDYTSYNSYRTTQNYSFLYKEEDMLYMFSTLGNGISKKAYIVDQFDIQEMRNGTMDDRDLEQRAVSCNNYQFGNVIHCVYRDGIAVYVMLCNINDRTLTIFGKLLDDKYYRNENRVILLGVERT